MSTPEGRMVLVEVRLLEQIERERRQGWAAYFQKRDRQHGQMSGWCPNFRTPPTSASPRPQKTSDPTPDSPQQAEEFRLKRQIDKLRRELGGVDPVTDAERYDAMFADLARLVGAWRGARGQASSSRSEARWNFDQAEVLITSLKGKVHRAQPASGWPPHTRWWSRCGLLIGAKFSDEPGVDDYCHTCVQLTRRDAGVVRSVAG